MTTHNHCRSLYVHVPFCRRKCGYCDFHSDVFDPAQVDPLVDALLAELTLYADPRRPCFDTVYVGGGTPTVLPASALRRLLRGLAAHADPRGELEFTVEANPATVDAGVATALVDAGVNRVSIGAQSFNPAELAVLDRVHQPEDVHQTVSRCRHSGIGRLSLDLIFGIPGQTLTSWIASLRSALALEPEHLSCYGLTYEPGTTLRARLDAGLVQAVDEELEARLYEATLEILPAAGLDQYEISNFARPGTECRHNLRYWHNEPYVGIGPAAAGFVNGMRYKNVAATASYVRAITAGESAHAEEEVLPPDRRPRETAILELRLTRGISRADFAARYGTDPVALFSEAVRKHIAGGLLEMDDETIRLTRRGLLLANLVMADFL